MKDKTSKNEIIIYEGDSGQPRIEVRIEGETVWLTQSQLVELFQSSKANISEHIKNIFEEGELSRDSVVRKFRTTAADGKTYEMEHYKLDLIISLGYRVKSQIATRFRQWATVRLREYIVKGFTIDSEKLKNLGGGNYWKELLDEIRDIRSSEKVLYRQVLDLYATAIDYDPKTDESLKFFKIVQNKIHFAAHGYTASEVIYLRVDSDKPFAGLTNFKGKQPTQAEAMIAKNYLKLPELKVLNNLVSAYFDIAEINAIEHKSMRMADYIRELDNILKSTGRKLLESAGSISHDQAEGKAMVEYRKYKAKTLSEVEKAYLDSLKQIEKKLKGNKMTKNLIIIAVMLTAVFSIPLLGYGQDNKTEFTEQDKRGVAFAESDAQQAIKDGKTYIISGGEGNEPIVGEENLEIIKGLPIKSIGCTGNFEYAKKFNETIIKYLKQKESGDVNWLKITPMDLIGILKECKNWISVGGYAPKGWIKKEDVEQLMQLIDSKESAIPVILPWSSYLPKPGQSSTVGNEAMFLIEGFKKSSYPPGICSVYGFNGNPYEYRKWWEAVKYELFNKQKHSYKPPLGYVTDKETAIKIAETILISIYSKDVIERERPFRAELADGIWIVMGTLKAQIGGVAVCEISKDTGEILRVSHGE